MKIVNHKISGIHVGTRQRALIEASVPALAENIKAHGLLHPITVWKRPDGTLQLLAGRHRLAAYVHNGETTIPTIEMPTDGLDETEQSIEAEFIELAENMARQGLTQGQYDAATIRAVILDQRLTTHKRIKDAADRHAAAPKNSREKSDAASELNRLKTTGKSDVTTSDLPVLPDKLAKGVTEAVAAKLCIRPNTVKDSITRARAVGPELATLVGQSRTDNRGVGTVVYDTQAELAAYAKLKKERQEIAATFIADVKRWQETGGKPPERASDLLKKHGKQDAAADDQDPAKILKKFTSEVADVIRDLTKLGNVAHRLEMSKASATLDKALVHVKAVRHMLDQETGITRQPITGKEGKYTVSSTH